MNQTAQGPLGGMLIPIIIIYAIFYFLVIRPQRKEQREHKNMIDSLKKNDEIITSSGIHGTIVNVKEKTSIVRIDDAVRMEINKNMIATVKKKANE